MRRQDKYPNTWCFQYHNENPKNRLTGDCVFRAISTALEKSWETVVMEMATLSCENGYSVSSKENIDRYLKLNGWEKQKQPRKADNTKYTGKEFCQVLQRWLDHCDELEILGSEWEDGIIIDRRIIAMIGGHHIISIVDGKVWDTWNSTDGCIGNYWIRF